MKGVSLRRLRAEESEYRMLETWCRQEAVYRYFEQRILTLDEIRRKYYPRTLENAEVPVFLIEWDGRPVGVVQYQRLHADSECRAFVRAENGYEIDIFIGEADARGKGVGRAAVELISEHLFEKLNADALLMCPLTENVRAIRCYQACGYEAMGRYTAPDTIGVRQEYLCMARLSGQKRA